MDNVLNSVDRMAPYTGSGKVAPSHHSEKDKERKKSETLERSFEDELDQKQKEHRNDTVTLQKDEQRDGESPDAEPEKQDNPQKPASTETEPEAIDDHIDLIA